MGGSPLTGYTHGGGTLSQVGPLQAYDPIFFFFHASIDKWLSMRQEMNPDKWIEESTDIRYFGTYTAPPYEKTNDGTPLTPLPRERTSRLRIFATSSSLDTFTPISKEIRARHRSCRWSSKFQAAWSITSA